MQIKIPTNKRLWFIFIVSIIFGSIILYGFVLPRSVFSGKQQTTVITITDGMTAGTIADLLHEKGLIDNTVTFRLAAKLQKLDNSLQAGDYAFGSDMNVLQMVGMLAKGETAAVLLTIPEGYTINQIAALIEENHLGSADKFKMLAKNYAPYQYMNKQDNLTYYSEGYLFPDTYKIPQGTTEQQILEKMVREFDTKFSPEMRAKAEAMGLTPHEVITLASLVEKEARLDEERPIIAGIFINRLKKFMPLQSCATVQYLLGQPKVELSVQDTEIESPYNTYLHMGLPPGPIANPGINSINAVLNPASTDCLYFVVDKEGVHHFSRSYEEHLAAISQVR